MRARLQRLVLEEFCAPAPDRLGRCIGFCRWPMRIFLRQESSGRQSWARAPFAALQSRELGLPSYNHSSWVRILDAADANDLAILVPSRRFP